MFNDKKLRRKGFTLVEVLVAVGIFAIASIIISAIFLNVNNLQQNTANYQKLQNDGRFIVEKLAREIRARELVYPVGTPYTDALNFKKDENSQAIGVARVDAIRNPATGKTIGNLEYSVYDEASGQTKKDYLNAEEVEVEDIKFFVAPYFEDVWGTEPTTNLQPRVTILLKIRNVAPNPKYVKEIVLQTTISSKVYKR